MKASVVLLLLALLTLSSCRRIHHDGFFDIFSSGWESAKAWATGKAGGGVADAASKGD